jgi:hypothetical protein
MCTGEEEGNFPKNGRVYIRISIFLSAQTSGALH